MADVRCYKFKPSNICIYFIGTYCVMGITLCSTNKSTYMISCDYAVDCGRENCFYNLTSMNNSLTDTIQGSSLIRITDQDIMYHLTVTNMDEFVVQSEELSFRDVEPCPNIPYLISSNIMYFNSETTTSSNGHPGNSGSGLSAGAIAAIAVAVFTVLILIATLIITLYLIKIGEITIFN